MARRTPPSFDFYPDDFIGGTEYFTAQEVGTYLRLLVHQFRQGSLPNDMERLMRITKEQNAETIGFVLSEKFVRKSDGSYVNQRMAEERQKKIRQHKANIANGRKGGRPKALSSLDSENPSVKPSVMNRETQGLTQTKPVRKKEVGSRKTEEGIRKPEDGSSEDGSLYSDDFEAFWLAFPSGRKKSKGAAWESWKKAVKFVDAAVLIQRAGEYARSDEGQGQYVKMPSTWLNQRCWEDDPRSWADRNGQRALNQGVLERALEKFADKEDTNE